VSAAGAPVRALVVDDSAISRQAIARVLERAGVDVRTAPDPVLALAKVRQSPPDVLVLDLEMPGMDGLTLLRRIMREAPLPVVVCSTSTGPGSTAAVEALGEGAVAVVEKRGLGVPGAPEAALLAEAVLGAVAVPLRARAVPRPAPRAVPVAAAPGVVLALGASTGGTSALEEILCALPPGAPPVVAVQHMPAGFTRALARRLDGLCALTVREAEGGEPLVPGTVLIAPGGRHLRVRASGTGLTAEVSDDAPVSRHRPSVDVLFRSVAQAAGGRAVAALLTGMGDDGADGLLALRHAGAWTIAQDEATSVVFGMPAQAVRRGAALEVLPLGGVAGALLARARRNGG
jgi:two-component system chemotaxis response regulator CheB